MIENQDNRIEIAGHALRRAQQRGVTRRAIYWTIEHGQSVRAVGGAVRRTLTRDSARRMIESGFPPAEVWRCPTEKNGRMRGGKHKPRHGNPRQQENDPT